MPWGFKFRLARVLIAYRLSCLFPPPLSIHVRLPYRLAQDSAILGVKLHQLKRKEVAGRVLRALSQARHRSLARALRAWVVGVTCDVHSIRVRSWLPHEDLCSHPPLFRGCWRMQHAVRLAAEHSSPLYPQSPRFRRSNNTEEEPRAGERVPPVETLDSCGK